MHIVGEAFNDASEPGLCPALRSADYMHYAPCGACGEREAEQRG